jgi:predicted phage terminase large subunit-like protein
MRRVGSDYYITDVIEEFWGPAEADERMVIVSKADGMVARQSNTAFMVRWEQEGGSSGTRNSVDLMKKLAGLDARGVPPRGDKFMRSTPLATQAMIKKVHLVKGSWNEHWLTHMHNQPNTPLKDIMDASSGAFQQLTMAGWSLGAGR